MTLARLRLSGAFALVLLTSAAYGHANMDLSSTVQLPPFLRASATERIEAVAEIEAFDPATALTFTIETDTGTFVNATAGSQWRCTREAKRVRCTADEAAPGSHPVLIDLTAPASGIVEVSTTITSISSIDPDDTNNRDRETSRVYATAACNANAPVLVQATTTDGVTELVWSAVPGATGYEVLAGVDGETLRRIASTNGTRAATRLLGDGQIAWAVRAFFADCPALQSEEASFSGTGAAATLRVTSIRSPLLTEPVGVALDGDDVLIAEAGQHALRTYYIPTNSVIDQLVLPEPGAPAPAFDGGITVGPGHFLFVADRSRHLLSFVFPEERAMLTAAGTPNAAGATDGLGKAARLRAPFGIVSDGRSQVFVADGGNNTIRRVAFDFSKGDFATTTFVNASAGLSDPAGLALDGAGNLLVADRGNHAIRRVTPAGAVTILAGIAGQAGHRDGDAAQALFHHPVGIGVDPWGNVYVSEEGNHTIRRIAPNGRVTTVAGTPGVAGAADGLGAGAAFNQPGLMAIGEDGVLWIADRGNGALRRAELGTIAPKRRAARK